jgi:hypothetical protein
MRGLRESHRLRSVARAYNTIAAMYGALFRGTSIDTAARVRWYAEKIAARPMMRYRGTEMITE